MSLHNDSLFREAWQKSQPGRSFVFRSLHLWVLVAMVGLAAAIAGWHARGSFASVEEPDVESRIRVLSAELADLRQQRGLSAATLNQRRNSICYLYAVYAYGRPGSGAQPFIRKSSGTGFIVADGVIATNRHVAQPWFEDEEGKELIALGYKPRLVSLTAFFPNISEGWELPVNGVRVDDAADVAVARFDAEKMPARIAPLPLAASAPEPGEAVAVLGYPMGTTAMVAKSPRTVYRRMAARRDGIEIARELAQLALIRPSATYGHLGDVVGETLIYDAATAHGGSGGPVLNARGEVIGINTAYLDGFAGSTVGVSTEPLKRLLARSR